MAARDNDAVHASTGGNGSGAGNTPSATREHPASPQRPLFQWQLCKGLQIGGQRTGQRHLYDEDLRDAGRAWDDARRTRTREDDAI